MTEPSDDDRDARLAAALVGDAPAGPGGAPRTGSPDGVSGGVPGASSDEPVPVAAIGERAARLLDAAAKAIPSGTAASTFRGPRFGALADCAGAASGERGAGVALLTLDALAGRADAGGGVPADVLDRALGTACRLYPARLLLFVRPHEAPAPEALFAFGFRRLIVRPDGVLHEYRLRDYKMPPDWLNARFWANPERFELGPDDEDDEEDEDGDDGSDGDEDDLDDEE